MAKEFDIKYDLPSDFNGIPVFNNQKATLFNFIEYRQDDDINNLWDLFEEAIRYADGLSNGDCSRFEMLYDRVISQNGVLWNITIGLFWIRPNTYISLDSRNREFIVLEHLLNDEVLKDVEYLKRALSGKEYLMVCKKVKEKLVNSNREYHTFFELMLE